MRRMMHKIKLYAKGREAENENKKSWLRKTLVVNIKSKESTAKYKKSRELMGKKKESFKLQASRIEVERRRKSKEMWSGDTQDWKKLKQTKKWSIVIIIEYKRTRKTKALKKSRGKEKR